MKHPIVFFAILLLSATAFAEKPDALLTKKEIIDIIKKSVLSKNIISVSYDENLKSVYVNFESPATPKANYTDLFVPWRDNQRRVLNSLKESSVPVSQITIETNFHDGSSRLKYTHKADDIFKYANRENEEQWLKTGEGYIKRGKSSKWQKI